MSGLGEFQAYVEDRRRRVAAIEARLLELQKSYESFFQELDQARESELGQLGELLSAERARLSPALDQSLKAAQAEVERDYDAKVAELTQRIEAVEAEAEQRRQESRAAEAEVRARNVGLDGEEEELKARNADLLARIHEFNERIRSLSGGFGFFTNLGQMRALHRQRAKLDRQQADVVARIDRLRAEWARVDEAHAAREKKLQEAWVARSAEAAALRTKLEYLQSSRERIVTRSTLEKVLFQLSARRELGQASDPACPRCKSHNPPDNAFCAYCAQRLGPDRPDLAGSWAEIAELNYHHDLFSKGMKACQELIGLLRGLGTGLENFARSVTDMRETEGRYPLPKLQIAVPKGSVEWGQNVEHLDRALTAEGALHPVRFATQARMLVDQVFTPDAIQRFFETMGQELSRQAGTQWG